MPMQFIRALEAIEIEVMQGKPTAGIFVHESEAGTGSLIATSKRSRHALAELGLSRPEWPFEADDRPLLKQSGKFPTERHHLFRRFTHDSFVREELLEQLISSCHGTANLVRYLL